MNENLEASPNAISFLKDFERGPRDGSVELSEGGAALTAYPCQPGGELTIGYGCLKWFDGEDVNLSHRLSGEAEAEKLLRQQLQPFVEGVRGMLTREPTQSQFDGMVCKAYNIGLAAFRSSSILTSFNEGRMEDAAANFGKWTGATCTAAPKDQREDPNYSPKIRYDHRGIARWVGPDGQDCAYMLRVDGLLYRCYAEALLFMNRKWSKTLRAPGHMKLELDPDHPSRATWNAGRGRWEDGVKYRTPFKDVYAKAYDDLLPGPADELVLTQPAPPLVATTKPGVDGGAAGGVPSPTPAVTPKVSPAPTVPPVAARKPEPVPASPAPPARAPVPAPLPTDVGSKPPVILPPSVQVNTQSDMGPTTRTMWVSKRFWGGVLIIAGRLIIVADVGGHFSPAVKSFIGDGVLMDWMTGVIVTMVGELILDQGEKKAKGPMDTPKRIALATPAP